MAKTAPILAVFESRDSAICDVRFCDLRFVSRDSVICDLRCCHLRFESRDSNVAIRPSASGHIHCNTLQYAAIHCN
eukprot:6671623-Lingulodinium_polyedra.AAC.1